MRAAVACCLLAACGFDHGKSALSDGRNSGDDDAADATTIDVPENCASYSTQFDTCMRGVGLGTMTVDLSGSNSYDTDTGVLTTPQGVVVVPHDNIVTAEGTIDVLFVASFTLHADAKFRVTGAQFDRAFGIASLGAVQIDGTIDLSSNGAGARDDADCTSDGTKGDDDDGGGGGGGGGAFGANGGNGGPGDGNGGQSAGGPGGTAVARPAHIVGGCDGGDGGIGTGNPSQGIGGDGGGAIFIATPMTIAVGAMGVINANGGGGTAGSNLSGGGGGGGSGGFILLEAPMITNAGKLVANGGGGGEGGDTFAGRDGEPGQVSMMRARGGSGVAVEGGDAADGGAGGAATAAGASATQLKDGGGGGGGGGVGFIATTTNPISPGGSVISPARQAWP